MTNIITACFGGTRYANTRPAWLIDHGMVLQITGVELPETYFVDFANSKAEQATRVLGNADGVVIPDQYFLSNAPQIFAWVYLTTGSSGFTTLQVTIPLAQRPDVSTEPPTPQETDLIEQAIAALNDGVERAETAADDAEEAVANIQQTVDDALQAAKDSGEFDGRDGVDGTDGVNGVTFTPDVDAAGNISWTNDGGLPNPQTRNIKGPKGDKLTYADLTAADKADLVQGPIADAQTAAVNAVNSKGEEVIQSIPSDYTELSEDVDDLKSAVNDPATGLATKAPAIIDTASGAIASFEDGADDMPIKALTVNIEPVQAGSGDPSPTNVRPISGWTGAKVTRTGKNLIDFPNAAVQSTGNINNAYNLLWSELDGRYVENAQYTFSCIVDTEDTTKIWGLNVTYTEGPGQMLLLHDGSTNYPSVTTARGRTISKIEFIYNSDFNLGFSNAQLELGAPATSYEPYQGNIYNITFPSEAGTVYGGTLDVTNGVLTVTNELYQLTGNENALLFTNNNFAFKTDANTKYYSNDNSFAISNVANSCIWTKEWKYFKVAGYRTVEGLRTLLANQDIYFTLPLKYPDTYQLTPQEVTTLLGTNNIWADCGPVDVDYPADTKLYIQKINALTDDDMISDMQIASGKYFLIGNTLYLSTTIIPAGDTIIPGTNCTKTDLAAALNALNT